MKKRESEKLKESEESAKPESVVTTSLFNIDFLHLQQFRAKIDWPSQPSKNSLTHMSNNSNKTYRLSL